MSCRLFSCAEQLGAGEDGAPVAGVVGMYAAVNNSVAANTYSMMWASFRGFPASVGRHYYAWLERSEATTTTTWAGDNGTPTLMQSGISGTVIQ